MRDGFLVAHVVFDPATTTSEASRQAVLDKLRSRLPLPSYMCPSLYVMLEDMPLTSHLKIDRRAIHAMPLPDAVQVSTDARHELSPTEEALAGLWMNIIPHRPNGLTPASDFFHVGGNSLLLVNLQAVIKRVFGTAPRLADLMNNSTLEAMATLASGSGGANTGAINWDAEVALDDALFETAQTVGPSAPHRSDKLRVLMTGATGNLGRYILPRLVQDDRVGQVVCIIRSESRGLLFSSSPIISVIEGDLSLPNLGLTETDFTGLAQATDVVLHCAANRNFWDGYEVLRPVNVGSVKTLARLALLNTSEMHILSSGAVEVYGEDAQPPTEGSDGYAATKWTAERYLSRASQELGLKVMVHRPEATKVGVSSTGFDSDSDSGNESVRAVAQELISLAKTMGTRPDFGRVEGTVHMASADEMAGRIVADVCGAHPGGEVRDLAIVHHAGNLRATTGDLALHASTMEGAAEFEALPAIPLLKWFGEAKRAGFRQFVTAQELVVNEGGLRLVSRR